MTSVQSKGGNWVFKKKERAGAGWAGVGLDMIRRKTLNGRGDRV